MSRLCPQVATKNFKTLIGRGGYGSVYKGKLLVSRKETMVAVKRLNEQFEQGLKEFLTENVIQTSFLLSVIVMRERRRLS
ncbi:serine-threonine/tyrosine-protein kinase catalytic domain-containing protein, partial [Tanacetum coccineum]